MKLNDVRPLIGTYVAVVPTTETQARLDEWADGQNLRLEPNLHVTVLYSRRQLSVEPQPKAIHIAKPLGFTALLGADIVLKLAAPSLALRHEVLRQLGGTHDFPIFLPHVTLLKKAGSRKTPNPITFELTFTNEYAEPLILTRD